MSKHNLYPFKKKSPIPDSRRVNRFCDPRTKLAFIMRPPLLLLIDLHWQSQHFDDIMV